MRIKLQNTARAHDHGHAPDLFPQERTPLQLTCLELANLPADDAAVTTPLAEAAVAVRAAAAAVTGVGSNDDDAFIRALDEPDPLALVTELPLTVLPWWGLPRPLTPCAAAPVRDFGIASSLMRVPPAEDDGEDTCRG